MEFMLHLETNMKISREDFVILVLQHLQYWLYRANSIKIFSSYTPFLNFKKKMNYFVIMKSKDIAVRY